MENLSPEKKLLLGLSDEEARQVLKLLAKNAVVASNMQKQTHETSTNALEQLNALIGLVETKEKIRKILAFQDMRRIAEKHGKKIKDVTYHMCFTGAPGTAKTTVARLCAKIFQEKGILAKGTFVEATRADLVAEYSGHTPIKVRKLFKKAYGGVLFIDEAYSLVEDREGGFGDEAINALVSEMENHRNEVVVILAGYPEKMKQFLERNPGLKSRIPFVVNFPDYTAEELFYIAQNIAKENGYALGQDVFDKIIPIFEAVVKTADFGNGRFARNLVEQALMNKALYITERDYSHLKDEELFTLTADDFSIPNQIQEGTRRSLIGFKT